MQSKMLRVLAPALVIVFVAALATTVRATVTQYPTRAAFNAAFPGAPLEDFEEARVPAGGNALMSGPLDKFTNNAIFLPNEIIDGLRVNVPNTAGFPQNMFVSGPGFANYVSHAISYNDSITSVPQMSIDLYNNNNSAIGLDLTSNPNGNSVTVTAFSGATNLGSFVVPNVQGSGTFFGISNNTGPITHLDFSSALNYFGMDNVAISAVPEPAAAIVIPLIGALHLARRRRGC